MAFQIAGAIILLLFYGIYSSKMISQKRKGICTDQIARGGKQGKLFRVELFLKIATYAVVAAEVLCLVFDLNWAPVWLRIVGAILACAGVLVFAVSVYTMRDSWRAGISKQDHTEFITTGIYAISRNPAFLGFDCTYFGLLLMFFHPILLLFTCFAAVMLHLQILQEEQFLPTAFGEAYTAYKSRVRRYLGRK